MFKINEIFNMDCVHFMQENKNFANLIIADPPFNIGYNYDLIKDNLPKDKYLMWSKEWISCAKESLVDNGTLVIFIMDEYVSEIDIICKDLGLIRKDWLIWHYSFGQSGKLEQRKKFTRSKTHILRYVKSAKEDFVFNSLDIAIPSLRQTKYNDKRACAKGKVPNDVLMFPRVVGNAKERQKHMSCQTPIALLEFLIKAFTNKNDIIYDPFLGSGSTIFAAKNLGRQYCGTELSKNYYAKIQSKIK